MENSRIPMQMLCSEMKKGRSQASRTEGVFTENAEAPRHTVNSRHERKTNPVCSHEEHGGALGAKFSHY